MLGPKRERGRVLGGDREGGGGEEEMI